MPTETFARAKDATRRLVERNSVATRQRRETDAEHTGGFISRTLMRCRAAMKYLFHSSAQPTPSNGSLREEKVEEPVTEEPPPTQAIAKTLLRNAQEIADRGAWEDGRSTNAGDARNCFTSAENPVFRVQLRRECGGEAADRFDREYNASLNRFVANVAKVQQVDRKKVRTQDEKASSEIKTDRAFAAATSGRDLRRLIPKGSDLEEAIAVAALAYSRFQRSLHARQKSFFGRMVQSVKSQVSNVFAGDFFVSEEWTPEWDIVLNIVLREKREGSITHNSLRETLVQRAREWYDQARKREVPRAA